MISPLIALMKDQVDAMARVGLRAAFLNSSLSPEERRERVRALRGGELELVYAAPEGLEASVGSALDGRGALRSSPSTRPTASATGATTSARPTGTWPGSRPASAPRCWP